MLALAGYADKLSVRPGEIISFKISNATGAPVLTRLVRVICADPNPKGPGIREEPVAAEFEGSYQIGASPVMRGSFATIGMRQHLSGLTSVTFVAKILPTRLGPNESSIVSTMNTGTDGTVSGFRFGLDASGRLEGLMATPRCSPRRVALDASLETDRWHLAWVAFNAENGALAIGAQPLSSGKTSGTASTRTAHIGSPERFAGQQLMIGAADGVATSPFNGRIEAPMLFARALSLTEIRAAATGVGPDAVIASWDFSQDIGSDRVIDTGPHGLHGRLVNRPTRAVTGSKWTGREMCWRHAPDEYAAIHFHDDDIDDCRWPTAFSWTAPEGLRSGTYAVRLKAGAHEDNIPFFVVPPRGKRTADIAVLVSTFTYVVYHNHTRLEWTRDPKWRADWEAQAKDWAAYPHNPGGHVHYGLSTYNYHSDGTGICFASWHRPMLNMRIGYVTYPYPDIRGSGLRHFPADTHLTAWLEAKGYAYDLVTDRELHHEGHDLLKEYRVVMTGSHPEYHTRAMLDALQSYRDGGGRFCYLGGNGFYWKIALDKDNPGHIEIRRGEGGIRAWAAEPGEYYNQLDGEYGGLWRRNGRPPQNLCGVGFTAQGNFVGSYYRKRQEAADSRAAWILDGIEDEKLGDFGLSGHGAAGFELDRTDKRLGTPAHAVVIASSENHPPDAPWVLVPEEQLTHLATWAGQPAKDLIRADMTFFETPNNGAVFSTGVDHLLRQPAGERLRQQHLAAAAERARPVSRRRCDLYGSIRYITGNGQSLRAGANSG